MNTVRPKTRDAIIEAAFAVFSKHPNASLGDVAQHAGVGRATLHRHFPGRAELIRALSLVASEELDRAVEAATSDAESATEALALAFHAVVPLANRQWFLAQDWQDTDPDVAAAYTASRQELHATMEEAKREGGFAPDVPTVWLVEAYENLVYAAWSVVLTGDATPKQAADFAWRTLTNGLKGERS